MSSSAAVAQPLLTVNEVAELLGVRPRTVYDLAKLADTDPKDPKALPFMFRVGGSWRARSSDVSSWIEQQATSRR
jgi:predicted DNA-binding transcriptional regulator AlpA|tara:strand:- start:73 stop:297 length:225 start_codon:yes stop_codon:yes gene_type:complete